MINDNNLEFVANKRYRVSEGTLKEITEEIHKKYGIDVVEILENDEGYVFRGKYGFTIGDLTYDTNNGVYKDFNYHRGVVESIKEREKRMKKRRQYKIQRNKRIGLAFTAAGMAALIGIGVIKSVDKMSEIKDPVSVETVAIEKHLNTIDNANDLVLIDWANYAMGSFRDYCAGSNIDAINSLDSTVYADIYVPVMSSYYNYLDCLDSLIPAEIVAESLEKNHNQFRNSAKEFNDYLISINLSQFSFEQSPFSDAIVFDKTGKLVESYKRFTGEVMGSDGELVTYDGDRAYTIYVQATDVPGNDFAINNLPDDARLFNGETYVDLEHFTDRNLNGVTK